MGEESRHTDGRTAADATAEQSDGDRGAADHLADLPEGSGCAEIWEELSERRADDSNATE